MCVKRAPWLTRGKTQLDAIRTEITSDVKKTKAHDDVPTAKTGLNAKEIRTMTSVPENATVIMRLEMLILKLKGRDLVQATQTRLVLAWGNVLTA